MANAKVYEDNTIIFTDWECRQWDKEGIGRKSKINNMFLIHLSNRNFDNYLTVIEIQNDNINI